jgi:hypothetical protein
MELLNWRRQKVYDLLVAGYNQTEIAQILKVSDHTIISRDVAHIRAQAKERIKTHLFTLVLLVVMNEYSYSRIIVYAGSCRRLAFKFMIISYPY